jgi:hypothetical protein
MAKFLDRSFVSKKMKISFEKINMSYFYDKNLEMVGRNFDIQKTIKNCLFIYLLIVYAGSLNSQRCFLLIYVQVIRKNKITGF